VKKLLITTILVLSCSECFSQSDTWTKHVPPTAHSIWFNKKVEFDVKNNSGAKNMAYDRPRQQYHVVIQIGDKYKWRKLAPTKKFKIESSRYELNPLYEMKIGATVEISPPHPVIPSSFDMWLRSSISINTQTQDLRGSLGSAQPVCGQDRVVCSPFLNVSPIFKWDNDALEIAQFYLRFFPPSGKINLRDNLVLSSPFNISIQ
jgi:hypothetical protein